MSNYTKHSKNGSVTLEPVNTPYSQRVASSTLLVDLRKCPRFVTRVPAELATEGRNTFPCIVTNISRTGLQLEGDRSILGTLRTASGLWDFIRRKTFIVYISFSLPDKIRHHNPVTILCKTVYAHEAKHSTTQAGVKFAYIIEGEDTLNEYLSFRELTD